MFHILFNAPRLSFNFQYEIKDLWGTREVNWCALDALYTLHVHHQYCSTSNTNSLWITESVSTGTNGLPYGLLLKLAFLV